MLQERKDEQLKSEAQTSRHSHKHAKAQGSSQSASKVSVPTSKAEFVGEDKLASEGVAGKVSTRGSVRSLRMRPKVDTPLALMENQRSEAVGFQPPASPQSTNRDKGQSAMEMELTETYGSKMKERDVEEWFDRSQEQKQQELSPQAEKKILPRNENASESSDAKARHSHPNFRDKGTRDCSTRKFFSFDWFLEPLGKYCLGIYAVRANRGEVHTKRVLALHRLAVLPWRLHQHGD